MFLPFVNGEDGDALPLTRRSNLALGKSLGLPIATIDLARIPLDDIGYLTIPTQLDSCLNSVVARIETDDDLLAGQFPGLLDDPVLLTSKIYVARANFSGTP